MSNNHTALIFMGTGLTIGHMDTTTPHLHKESVHTVLAYSYSAYFVAFLIGIILYFLMPGQEPSEGMGIIGIVVLGLGTLLLFWAQSTSRETRPIRNDGTRTSKDFAVGPYRFTRSPTHLGIAIMLVAFSLLVNSSTLFIVALVSYLATRLHFIKKEEDLLAEKYGAPYREYQEQVRF